MLKKRLINTLKITINSLEDDLDNEKRKNEVYKHDLTILVESNTRLNKKISDLEQYIENLNNNIEILFHNLPENIKELVRPEVQN